MNASEETRLGRSVVADTLQTLTNQAGICRTNIDLLEAGQYFNRAEVVADLGKLLDACQNLRDAILSEDSVANWKTKEQLHALINRLDDAAEKRRQYLDLAQFLANGTIVHRRERTRLERLAERDAAVSELMEISALSSPPELPGPAADEWLTWACSLEDGSNEPDLLRLKNDFPRLDDFVRQLEIEWWQNSHATSPVQLGGAIAAIQPKTKLASTISMPAIAPAASIVEASPQKEPEAPIAEVEEPETITLAPLAVAAEVPAAEIAEPVKEAPPVQEANKKHSFFALEEIEGFTRSIEREKAEPKEAGKTRALIAVSNWLSPNDQNPVLHARCGIRAQTGYVGASALAAVTAEDAAEAIEAEGSLPLLAGGTDLLRWAIAQGEEDHSFEFATVRRLSIAQLRVWFGEIYKIELADQQILDIHKLTSGIPLLVGEMHRLIIPYPNDPPTWLGHVRWVEIKASFVQRLPELAHEFRSGTPAVRLTYREINLLKMVVLASDSSTPEKIVAHLTDNWVKFKHPELHAVNPADEPSFALLQGLGLLPSASSAGLGSIEAIVPLEHDDAIRQLVSHL